MMEDQTHERKTYSQAQGAVNVGRLRAVARSIRGANDRRLNRKSSPGRHSLGRYRCVAIAGAILLAACSTTLEAQVWSTCKALIDTSRALHPLKAKMSVEQRAVIHEALLVTQPICVGGNIGDPKGALDTVHSYLEKLVTVQAEVK